MYVSLSIHHVISTIYQKNQKKLGRLQVVVNTFKFDTLEHMV